MWSQMLSLSVTLRAKPVALRGSIHLSLSFLLLRWVAPVIPNVQG